VSPFAALASRALRWAVFGSGSVGLRGHRIRVADREAALPRDDSSNDLCANYGVTTCAAGGWYVERIEPIAPRTGWNVTDVGVTESLRIESVTDGGRPTSESARAAASETSF
jgi:hypothetical protein